MRTEDAKTGIRNYLCSKFNMQFEPRDKIVKGIDSSEIAFLTEALIEERNSKKDNARRLAENDALHALRIFAKRHELDEHTVPNPFGYRTWWLTHERAVRRAVVKFFKGKKPQFIMRPEFLLNYIALSPTTAAVAKSYASVFPSVLGVRLGKRFNQNSFNEMLNKVKEAYSVDEHRAKAIVTELVDILKGDQIRIYERLWDDSV